ncbi:MAG: ATP-binding protein [Roseiflexaceae bacterium]|nr:ATP-binding protein [Roseiflexaceae bacterium]
MQIIPRAPTTTTLRPVLQDPAIWCVIVILGLVTMLHYLTDMHLIPYHSIYRSLYYIPIAIAAVRYGRRGGILTALTTSILYIPHVVLSWAMMPADAFNDLLENVIFLFVGAFAGHLADAERIQRQRAQEAALQLATANTRLQEQADLAERMRASVTSILESLGTGVITVDQSRRLTTANRVARTLFNELAADQEGLPDAIQNYLTTGGRGYRQIAAGTRTLGLRGAALHGLRDEVLGTVLVVDDLTEIRHLEEQVQRSQRLAALGRLAGGLAHEIRNPLAIVRAAAQMLQRELEATTYSEYTLVIQTEIDRVDRLIEQLLAYARPRMLARNPIKSTDLIERTLQLTRAYATQQHVTLSARIGDVSFSFVGDAELLHQALVNLLMNAIQATPAGGAVCVMAQAHEGTIQQPMIEIVVRDTGRGIAPIDHARIFDPFFTTRDDGVGLGLSIVQEIVQDHGGTIDITSELGVGTIATIQLPCESSLFAAGSEIEATR